jgi:hypothetical protein
MGAGDPQKDGRQKERGEDEAAIVWSSFAVSLRFAIHG